MIFLDRNKKKISLKSFLFFGVNKNFFSSTQIITLLALLIALRLILQFFSIYIPQFSMSISVAWIPVIIIGWIFGPIIGFVVGGISDTLAYLIKPSQVWFWIYSIQEPIVGFLAGIISFLYQMRIYKMSTKYYINEKKQNIIDIILFNLFFIIFLSLTLVAIFYWADENFKFQGSNDLIQSNFFSTYKYLLFAVFIFFFISIEIFFIYFIKKKKRKALLLLVYVSTLIIINAMIFSFILGPISSIEYFKFLNDGREPSSFIKYGVIYYLVPRVLKESIKSPIQIFILVLALPIVNFMYKKFVSFKDLKW